MAAPSRKISREPGSGVSSSESGGTGGVPGGGGGIPGGRIGGSGVTGGLDVPGGFSSPGSGSADGGEVQGADAVGAVLGGIRMVPELAGGGG